MKRINFVLLFVIIIGLLGCTPKYTSQKAISDVEKAYKFHPDTVAVFTRSTFPCITTEINRVVETKDSIVYLECPDIPTIIHIPGETDTIINTVEKTIRVPFHLPVQTIYLTKSVEDSAKIFSLNSSIIKLNIVVSQLQDKNGSLQTRLDAMQKRLDDMTGKRDYWRIRFFILLGIIILYTGLKIFSSRIPFINKL